MVLGGLAAAFLTDSLKRLAARLYPEARPGWAPVAAAVVLVLVLGTWGKFFLAMSMEHFVVTLVMSLGLAKILPLVFFYKETRGFVTALLDEPLALRVIALSSAAVGAAVLVMAIFF